MLQTSTVIPDTLELLRKLQLIDSFRDLRLVGGTALSLLLGHRMSIDLDLFGTHGLDREEIIQCILDSGIQVVEQYHSKSIFSCYCNDVKVDIVDYNVPWLRPVIEQDGIRLANLEDIVAMKLYAITGRGRKKDFVDLYFLLDKFTLSQMLDFFQEKYPYISVMLLAKSILYFRDCESEAMPKMLIPVAWETVKERIVSEVKQI
jgi:predicted nucleotidyltransferase component of viral defense system